MRREDLDGGDAAEVSPVVAVRGEGDVGVVIAEMLAGEEARAVGQDDVVFGEALANDRGRRNDNDKTRAKTQREDLAVALGNEME